MSEMYHFIYKTTCKSGKYYVGRHSTCKLNDNYFGSGKWVKSIKDKSILSREILEFFDDSEQLKLAEQLLLFENIDKPNNMNYNNNATGFSSGDYHHMKTEIYKNKYSNIFKNKPRPKFSNIWIENISLGHIGLKQSQENINKRVEKNSIFWKIIYPNGLEIIIKNLSKFCRDNNLDQGNMCKVAHKEKDNYKGWRCSKL